MSSRTILDLPREIIDAIVAQIDHGRDRINFAQTCKILHKSVEKTPLEGIDVEFGELSDRHLLLSHVDHYPMTWSSIVQNIDLDQWRYLSSINRGDKLPQAGDLIFAGCNIANCRACTLASTFGAIDLLLDSQLFTMARKCDHLTFCGSFGERTHRSDTRQINLRHSFLSGKNLAALNLQRFEFNMHWRFWDTTILEALSTSELVELKVPFGVAGDADHLAQALLHMERLRSLTVTDIPARSMFLERLPLLGLGVLARRSSLRSLDLSVTNYNRPSAYCCYPWNRTATEDEPFIKPATLDFFFNSFFPSSIEHVPEHISHRFAHLQEAVTAIKARGRTNVIEKEVNARLSLEKLRLEHIDLPHDAFTRVFDGAKLKQLQVPCSRVHDAVWSSIGATELEVLECIDYDTLPRMLNQFLSMQNSMQSLGFARPTAQYAAVRLIRFEGDEDLTLCMRQTSYPSPMGQGTVWGRASIYAPDVPGKSAFPTFNVLLDSISTANITNLHLPADMYDVTPDSISTIGCRLQSLQNLSWGFDYSDPDIRAAFQTSFLSNTPNLRKITFLSLNLPSGWNGINKNDLAFNAPLFHIFIISLAERVPTTIRYLRYEHLVSRYSRYEPRRTTIYYHRQFAPDGIRWICLDEHEAESMFGENRTPALKF